MKQKLRNAIVDLVATFFYSGKSKFAPGTCGSIAGLIAGMPIMHYLGRNVLLGVTILTFPIFTYVADLYAKRVKKDDPSEVVIDEVSGMWLSMYFYTYHQVRAEDTYATCSIKYMLLAFLLFRVFDIWKPWPIRAIDKNLKGGFGIMMDDVVAAFFVGLVAFVL